MMKLPTPLLALLLTFAAGSQAQQLLPLDSSTEHRLGLVFVRLAAPDQQAGTSVPAQVINSPLQQSTVVAVHEGVLEAWTVAPGDRVEAGALLGVVRSSEALTLQQAWLDARAAEQLAAAALLRDRQLLEDGLIAASRLQQTQREYERTHAALQASASQLQVAGYSNADLNTLSRDNTSLGQYRLLARQQGNIAHLHVLPGAAVSRGDTLLSLTGDSLWLSAEIPARLAGNLVPGQSLHLEREGAALTLQQLDRNVDSMSQTVGLLAEFDAPASLLPGQLVNLVLPGSTDGVLIPADAVVRNGNQTSVYVRSEGGVESRVLQLQVLGSDYLATSGIEAGDEVVIRGAALLKGIELGLGGE